MSTWILVLLRSIGLFFLTLIVVRILTKNYSVRITPFRIINYGVIAILISLVSVNAISNWVFGIITLAVWILLPIVLDYISMKSKYIYNLINGKETILVKDGKVMEENLTELGLTGDELLRELRSKNAFNLADVEFAVMESTGDMNVVLKSDKKPITPHDLGIKVSPETAPQTVIIDGNVINESLSNLRLNQTWLNEKLENLGVSLDNVFVGQVDCNGELYVDVFDDSIELPEASVKEMLYASLEKSQADIITFSLETENVEAKDMYVREANRLKTIMKKLEPYLLR
ncbi:hypothetical protein Ccar_02295 [Clostridium carboxidivorans P7]|uniref:YetF C-terminal domain-containing protein n=1 Tax=Clostridium carboxidivorans P7 TaxID=536227 RepID=C6PWB9_9CLOT|nr:DUF421 domain-containing protein [Clostridium carboxidivorans]AKN29739.1 hypothetical protein Ccar_02295 [Clostridium carboxidivorans P7]EET86469.1 protein of unknown function DUF421 [Clostridium carboxidivorans P7]EFG89318.1 hypothetical protein CLCAR_0471 [Clostridium carboxidivorans P7]